MKNNTLRNEIIQSLARFCLLTMLFAGCNNSVAIKETTNTTITSKDDEKTLRYLKEVEWPKAYREQDTILLDQILGDDFKMIDQSGNWYTKKDELDWIKNNAPKNDSFHYEIKRFEILENGTAIIAEQVIYLMAQWNRFINRAMCW